MNEQSNETKDTIIENAELRFEKKLTELVSGLREDITRGDASLRRELVHVDSSLREEIRQVDSSLREEITGLREDMVRGDCSLREEIHKAKSETVKWMFIFSVGQIGVILGLLFAFFK